MENITLNGLNSENTKLIYIPPNLSEYNSFEELLNDKKYDGNFSFLKQERNFKVEDFFHNGSYFVVGEPGCGKSTLLGHIAAIAEKNFITSHKISLTDIKPEELRSTITNLHSESSQKTLNVSFENYIFCLDALDEVDSGLFSRMINEIIQFNLEVPEFKLLVACRTHYLSKNINIIRRAANFKFIKVQPFSNIQVSEFIKKYSSEEFAKTFAAKTQFYNEDMSSIIRVPRYLNIQLQLAAEVNNIQDFNLIKRADFFEKFIYQKLERDSGENEKNILTKRVLEKLALIMEIYQVNKITRDELITFLDETNSNINLIFLNSESIDKFIERVLKSTEDVLEFDNTEFQEYLAAKELLRLGQKSQILFDLVVEPNFKQIFPNWFDVLKYVVEIDPPQLVNVMEFLKHRIDKLVSEDIFALLSLTNVEKLSNPQKAKVFDIVYNYYQKHELFIWKYAAVLAEFYTDDNEILFDISLSSSYSTILSNELYVLSYLIERKCFKPVDALIVNVKERIVKESNKDLINQYVTLLQNSSSWDALVELKAVSEKNDEIFKNYIRSVFHINPNSEFSLTLIFEAIERDIEDHIRYFNMITEPALIKKMLTQINEDFAVLDKLIDRKDHFYPFENYGIFQTVLEIWDSELSTLFNDQLEYLLKEGNEYELRTNGYFKNLIETLEKKDENFLGTFLTLGGQSVYFAFFEIILKMVNESTVTHLKNLSSTPLGGSFLFNLFTTIKTSNNELYVNLKSFLLDESEEIFNGVEAYQPGVHPHNDEVNVRLFHEQINNNDFHVFDTLIKNKDLILARAEKEDLEKLKSIILNVFDKTSPDQLKITVTNDSGSGRNYNLSNHFVYDYATYLEAGLILGMKNDLLSYRTNFVKLLPLFEHSDSEKVVFDFVGQISEDDVKLLTEYFSNRTDDLIRVFATSFIKTVTLYKIKGLLPIVRFLLTNPTTYSYERISAIRCIGEVEQNKEELENLFATYSAANDSVEMAEIANEFLIKKHMDKSALMWRLGQIKSRKFSFKRNYASGMRPYSEKERELDHLTFAKSLLELKETSFIPEFNDLLNFSFDIRSDDNYEQYSNYVQQIVFNFYKGLKYGGSLSPLKQLSLFFNNHNSQYKNSFKSLLKDLEIEYSESVLKPNNIFECVKKYNGLKEKDYLPVANDFELRNVVMEVIGEDLNNFVANEGFYKPMLGMNLNEDMMQKILKIQIENALYKRGFRTHDVYREPQLHNDRRPDFIISYGFIGPVVLELKFISNPQISNSSERAEYKKKLENNYRRGFNAKYGVYLVLEKENRDNSILKGELIKEYSDLKEWSIHFLKCYQD